MKRTCVLLALTALLISLPMLAGCARKPAAAPFVPSHFPQAGQKRVAADQALANTHQELRVWQQSLSPQDRRTLDTTGKLVIPYATLKTADPAHAKIVDELFRQQIKMSRPAGGGGPAPDLGAPKTITFTKEITGQYTFMLDTTGGASFRLGLTPIATSGK